MIDAVAAYKSASTALNETVPQIALFPSSFDYGATAVRSTTPPTNTFTIVNQGTGNLVINSTPNGSTPVVSFTGANPSDFAITEDTCSGLTIGPPLSCSVTAAFSPTSIGPKSAALSIQSNDATAPVLNVSLTGTVTITIAAMGMFRSSLGEFFLRNTNTTGPAYITVQFGSQEDILVIW